MGYIRVILVLIRVTPGCVMMCRRLGLQRRGVTTSRSWGESDIIVRRAIDVTTMVVIAVSRIVRAVATDAALVRARAGGTVY